MKSILVTSLLIVLLTSCSNNVQESLKMTIEQESVLNYPINDLGIYFYEMFKNRDKIDFRKWGSVNTFFGPRNEKSQFNEFSSETNRYYATIKNSKFENATFGDDILDGERIKRLDIYYTDLNTNYKYNLVIWLGNRWQVRGGQWNEHYYTDKYYFKRDAWWFFKK